MTPDVITRTIQLVLAPVVVVSASSIFVGGVLACYTNLSDRIRAMTSERLDLLRRVRVAGTDGDLLTAERLPEIDMELPDLAHRHRLLHHALLTIYLAILILVASMCLTALTASVPADWIMGAVLVLFVCGVLALLLGVGLVALEVRTSQRALQFEVDRILRLDCPSAGSGPTSTIAAAAVLSQRVSG